jgi:DNA polymerase III subunit delta
MPEMSEGTRMITTLCGTNAFRLQLEQTKRVDAFVKKHGDFNIERFDAEEAEYDALVQGIQSTSLFAESKLVLVRSASANKQFAENIEELTKLVPEETELILIEPKVDKRSAYYKFIKKHTTFVDCGEQDARELPSWLVEQAKAQGATLSQADARYLVERVGTKQAILFHELEKLSLYDVNITRQTIDLLTEATPQSNIFQLLEAAFAGNTKRALALYDDQRQQGVEAQQILAMIIWHINQLSFVVWRGERSEAEVAKEAGLNPFTVKKAIAATKQISKQRMRDIIRHVWNIDIQLKTSSVDADEVLRELLVWLGR